MKNNTTTFIIAIVLALGIGFFAGTKYQSSKAVTIGNGRGQFTQGQGRNGGQAFMNGRNGQTIGEIISVDDKSITVKMNDGSSKIVILGSTLNINKASAGTKADLTVGTRVGVFGNVNSDGSVTAQSIQINPIQIQRGATPSATPAAK